MQFKIKKSNSMENSRSKILKTKNKKKNFNHLNNINFFSLFKKKRNYNCSSKHYIFKFQLPKINQEDK